MLKQPKALIVSIICFLPACDPQRPAAEIVAPTYTVTPSVAALVEPTAIATPSTFLSTVFATAESSSAIVISGCRDGMVSGGTAFKNNAACKVYISGYSSCACNTGDALTGSLCVGSLQTMVSEISCVPRDLPINDEALTAYCVSAFTTYKQNVGTSSPGKCAF